MIDCEAITPIFRPIEKLIYDTIDNLNLRVVFATDKYARDLADTIVLRGYNSDTYRDIVNYNEYIFEKYNVDLFKTCLNIESTEALYNLFLRDGEARATNQEEPEIVNYKACWEALRDHVDHVIDRLSDNKESSHNASALLSYLDISNQMKFIEELDLNSHWTKLSTANKIKALQNVDI